MRRRCSNQRRRHCRGRDDAAGSLIGTRSVASHFVQEGDRLYTRDRLAPCYPTSILLK